MAANERICEQSVGRNDDGRESKSCRTCANPARLHPIRICTGCSHPVYLHGRSTNGCGTMNVHGSCECQLDFGRPQGGGGAPTT